MSDSMSSFTLILVSQWPMLIVSVIGIFTSVFYLRKSTVSSILCLSGCALYFLAIVAYALAYVVIERAGMNGAPISRTEQLLNNAAFIETAIDALSFALVIAGTFVGRACIASKGNQARV